MSPDAQLRSMPPGELAAPPLPHSPAPPVLNDGETAPRRNVRGTGTGRLIVNADDWGRDRATTDCIGECCRHGSVSSVSAMVFMEDSERAAELALERGVDAGLHLNFTTDFSAPGCPRGLAERQQRIARYLLRRRLHQVVFHPGLAGCFAYVVAAQTEEFRRLYGHEPKRVDGHHHMHLCANVMLQGLLPEGIVVRRNFSFQAGEKGLVNRFYRKAVDSGLGRRHFLVDYLFSLEPLEDLQRRQRILGLAMRSVVELETHPVNNKEYQFLTSDTLQGSVEGVRIESSFAAGSMHGREVSKHA